MRYLLFIFSVFCITIQSNAQWYDEEKDLEILSWNIHMLPHFIYRKTKKRIRAKAIAEELQKSTFNIIVFQEAFHKPIKRKIQKILTEQYPYSYGPVNKKFFSIWTNSGIWFLSDRPLINLDAIKFSTCKGDGCYARKGALMMEGEHLGNRFQIIGTHNNGGWPNNSQFHQIRSELLDVYYKDGVPQIICGDFNTNKSSNHQQWEVMINLFDADTSIIQKDERGADHKITFPTSDIYLQFPDFIFVRKNKDFNLNVTSLSMFSMGPTWKQEHKKIYLKSVGLSDHFPVRISMNWKERNFPNDQ